MLEALLLSQYWAARSLAETLTVGKHHPKIKLDRTFDCASHDKGGVRSLGVLAEAKGYGGLGLHGSSNGARVAEHIAIEVEGYVNLLSRKNDYPSVR